MGVVKPCLAIAAIIALSPSLSAIAEPKQAPRAPKAPAPAAPAPWEEDSTPAQRQRAHEVFSSANELFFKRDYARASERYEEALSVFDHPRIRLALARTLVRVGRPAEAHVHLMASLRWGAAPFDADEHVEATEMKAALANQLGVLVIRCAKDSARLTLDGKDIDPCPGEQRHVVMPGRHQLVGKQSGWLTYTHEPVAEAGREIAIDVALVRPDTMTKQRRWQWWKPWTIVAVGGAVALGGVPFQFHANSRMDEFRGAVNETCGTTGCRAGSPELAAYQAANLDDIEASAKLYNRIAVSLWIAGGAVAATGLVAVVLNRERIMSPNTEGERLSIVPVASSEQLGFAVFGLF